METIVINNIIRNNLALNLGYMKSQKGVPNRCFKSHQPHNITVYIIIILEKP